MDHQEFQELLALHSLGALDVSEARVVEEHVAGCAECGDEFVQLRDDAGLLAYAATPAEPRPEVRAQILEAFRNESQNRQTVSAKSASVAQFRPRERASSWSNTLRIAAAIAFIALLAGAIMLWKRESDSRRQVAILASEVARQQREIARGRELLAREREMLALVASPNSKKTELAGMPAAQNARGMFVFDRQTGKAMLMAEGLPPTPENMAYELWFIADGRPMPGKVFTVDASGRVMISDQVPTEARERAVYAITLEPKGGVTAPTGAMYLSSPSS